MKGFVVVFLDGRRVQQVVSGFETEDQARNWLGDRFEDDGSDSDESVVMPLTDVLTIPTDYSNDEG